MFSYDWLTDSTRPLYERLLDMDAASYHDFKNSTEYRKGLSHKVAFRAWWNLKARTGYKTTDDLLRYKRELFERVSKPTATTAES